MLKHVLSLSDLHFFVLLVFFNFRRSGACADRVCIKTNLKRAYTDDTFKTCANPGCKKTLLKRVIMYTRSAHARLRKRNRKTQLDLSIRMSMFFVYENVFLVQKLCNLLFWHGFGSQSYRSVSQFLPVNPDLQIHWYVP